MTIKLKRVYEPWEKSDGYRILVDRLWPRGIKKETAHLDQWIKEAGPSTALRKWFDHKEENWQVFSKKYQAELKGTAVFNQLRDIVSKKKIVTLLYSAKNEKHNQAVALRNFLIK